MAEETFATTVIFQDFILPFLLIFALVFAVLERTKLFGEDKKQINAIISLVIGLIFVSVVYPREVVGNLVLFLSVALVVLFVLLLLTGFVDVGADKFNPPGWFKLTLAGIVFVAVVLAVIWATGYQSVPFDFLFGKSGSGIFWTNVLFIAVIAGAIAAAMSVKNKD
jgi:hypothetical protein